MYWSFTRLHLFEVDVCRWFLSRSRARGGTWLVALSIKCLPGPPTSSCSASAECSWVRQVFTTNQQTISFHLQYVLYVDVHNHVQIFVEPNIDVQVINMHVSVCIQNVKRTKWILIFDQQKSRFFVIFRRSFWAAKCQPQVRAEFVCSARQCGHPRDGLRHGVLAPRPVASCYWNIVSAASLAYNHV